MNLGATWWSNLDFAVLWVPDSITEHLSGPERLWLYDQFVWTHL